MSNDNVDIDSMLDELDRQERTDFFGSFSPRQQQDNNVACKPGVDEVSAFRQQERPPWHDRRSDFDETNSDVHPHDSFLLTQNHHHPAEASTANTPMSEESIIPASFLPGEPADSEASLRTNESHAVLPSSTTFNDVNDRELNDGVEIAVFTRTEFLPVDVTTELSRTRPHAVPTNTAPQDVNNEVAELIPISFSPPLNDAGQHAVSASNSGENFNLLANFGIEYSPAPFSTARLSSQVAVESPLATPVGGLDSLSTLNSVYDNKLIDDGHFVENVDVAASSFIAHNVNNNTTVPDLPPTISTPESASPELTNDTDKVPSVEATAGHDLVTDGRILAPDAVAFRQHSSEPGQEQSSETEAVRQHVLFPTDADFDDENTKPAVEAKHIDVDVSFIDQPHAAEDAVSVASENTTTDDEPGHTDAAAKKMPETNSDGNIAPPPSFSPSETTTASSDDHNASAVRQDTLVIDDEQKSSSSTTDSQLTNYDNTHDNDDVIVATPFVSSSPGSSAAVPLGRPRRYMQAVDDLDDAKVDSYLKSDFLTPKIDDTTNPPGAAGPSAKSVVVEPKPSANSTTPSLLTKSATGWLGTTPGAQPPEWVPDEMAPLCMSCGLKFTLVRRRHHCRCCGRVLCSQCCNSRAKLAYLPAAQSEARVCAQCCADLLLILTLADGESPRNHENVSNSAAENANEPSSSAANVSADAENNENPETEPKNTVEAADYGDEAENRGENDEILDSAATKPRAINISSTSRPASGRGSGTSSILKRPNAVPSSSAPSTSSSSAAERRSVMFSDGIRPGGDLAEMYSSPPRSKPYARMRKSRTPSAMCAKPSHLRSCPAFIDKPVLPVTDTSVPGGHRLNQTIGRDEISKFFTDENENSLEFAVSTDVRVTCRCSKLKFWHAERRVWCFTTRGLRTVGQNEFIFLLERADEEVLPPHDVFKLVHYVYMRVCTGKEQPVGQYGVIVLPNTISNTNTVGVGSSSTSSALNVTAASTTFLGRKDIAGVIFVRPTNLQSVAGITLPEAPYYAALLVMKYEMPWARHFPLRLILSLGAKFQYYPCPLVNVRDRDCALGVAGDNAHATIMSLLCDFRFFKYTLPRIPGAYCIITTPLPSSADGDAESSAVTSSFHNSSVTFSLPKSHYDMVMHVLGTSADNVLAFGTDFVADRKRAAAHLVAVQYDSDDGAPGGQFETRAVGPTTSSNNDGEDAENNTIAALFVVFNRKLKGRGSDSTTLDDKCRLSIVEDGVMIEITSDAFDQLKASLRKMANVKYDILSAQTATSDDDRPTSSAPVNCVSIVWIDDGAQSAVVNENESSLIGANVGVTSPLDGRSLATYKSQRVQIQDSTDYINGRLAVRCTEVFFLRPATAVASSTPSSSDSSFADLNSNLARLINALAQAVCRAVQPYLPELRGSAFGVSLFSVRTNLAATVTSYEIGANGAALEMPQVLGKLDELLIPVLYGGVQQQPQSADGSAPAQQPPAGNNINCHLELFFRII